MIRIAVVDDDLMFLDRFEKLLLETFSKFDETIKVSMFTCGTDFQKAILRSPYNLVFLDIDLPDLSGMKIASLLRKQNIDTTLVFVSAHNQFVFESIQYKPFRFIRKSELAHDVDDTIQGYCDQQRKSLDVVTLLTESKREQPVQLKYIMYFYSLRHDIYVVLYSGKSMRLAPRQYTLESLENELNTHGFIRSHKTFLVNCKHIYKILSTKIILTDQTEIRISRGHTDEVKQKYQLFLREEEKL